MFCIVYCKCACAMGTIMFQLKGLNRHHHQPPLPLNYYTGSVHHIHNSGTAMPKDMLEYLINYQKFLWPNSPDFRLILFPTTDARRFLFYPFSTFRSVRQFLNFNFLPFGIFVQQIKRNFTCFHFRRYFAAHLNNLSA